MKNTTLRAQASYTLSEADIQKMIDNTTHLRDRLVILFLAYTGCRRGELCRIKIKHIDLENDRLYLPTLKRREDPELVLRPVPILSARFKQDLITYLEIQKGKDGLKPDNYLFQQRSNCKKNGLTPERINQIISEVAAKARIKPGNPQRRHISPHQFRHSFVRFARKSGLDFKIIQQIMGHASISTTLDMYGIPGWEDIKQETQEKLGDFLMRDKGDMI